MAVKSCIPVIPSANLEKSLRLWVDGLGFKMSTEMRAEGRLVFCMLHKGDLRFILNQRAGTLVKPDNYEGIRLYWNPINIHETRERLITFSLIINFFLGKSLKYRLQPEAWQAGIPPKGGTTNFSLPGRVTRI